MFYNVFIKSPTGTPSYIPGLEAKDVEKVVEAYCKGERNVRISGTRYFIHNPKIFKIFKVNEKYSSSDEIAKNLEKAIKYYNRNKIEESLFREDGEEVTEQFLKGRDWNSEEPFFKSFTWGEATQLEPPKNQGKIFISHSSKDVKIVKAFVDKILKLALGFTSKDIFCSSIDGTGIKTGEDFRKVIREEIKNSVLVIQIITKNYKDSEVCLNEMGAAWVLHDNVIPFIVEPVNYGNIGFIHSPNQLLKLNDRKKLFKFIDDLPGNLKPSEIVQSTLWDQIEEFQEVVEQYIQKQEKL